MSLHEAAVDVADSLLVGLVPGRDGVASEREFGYMIVLDGVEVLPIDGYALHSVIGIEASNLSKVAFGINLLSHQVRARQRAEGAEE